MSKTKGMPSILGDVVPPFSGQKPITGVSPEFDQIYTLWKTNQNPETNTKILTAVQPVVDSALTNYAGNNATPTMRSKARLMALKALTTFDPKMGNVRTHLLSQLQSLRRAAAKEQNIISIPEQVGLDFQHITTAENELRDQYGRDPTDDELSDYTSLSKRRIQKIRKFNQPIAEGTVSQIVDADSGGGGEVASEVPGQTNAADAWMNFVYDDLGPTDKLIMDLTLGRNGRRRASTQDIAKRLRLTPGAISQRAAKIQAMLDKRFSHGGF